MISVRLAPSAVEGLADVSDVTIHPDPLEVLAAGQLWAFPFAGIARPQGRIHRALESGGCATWDLG